MFETKKEQSLQANNDEELIQTIKDVEMRLEKSDKESKRFGTDMDNIDLNIESQKNIGWLYSKNVGKL